MWFLKSSLNLETSSLNVNLQVFWDKMGFLTALGSIWYIIYDYSEQQYSRARVARIVASWLPGCEEIEREWGNKGEMERDWLTILPHSFSISFLFLHFLILSPFPPSLSISYIKMRHILLQNVKYGTFVTNVTKILTYALWGNNSGPNNLRGSSASCVGLDNTLTYRALS